MTLEEQADLSKYCTHLEAEVVKLESERDRMKAELEKSEATCAVMREALEYCKDFVQHKPYGTEFKLFLVETALSTDCGTAILARLKELEGLK